MKEIWLPEGLHVGHAVRPLYPTKYELGVVFWHGFVRVWTPNGAGPPLSVNIKVHGRLKEDHPQSNLSNLSFIEFTFLFLFTLLFQPHVLFLYYLCGMRGRPSWLAKPRTTQGAPAPTGSLPGGRALVSHWWSRRPRCDRPSNAVWPPFVEALQGALSHACWLRKGMNSVHLSLTFYNMNCCNVILFVSTEVKKGKIKYELLSKQGKKCSTTMYRTSIWSIINIKILAKCSCVATSIGH
jgi:hypothetical protein